MKMARPSKLPSTSAKPAPLDEVKRALELLMSPAEISSFEAFFWEQIRVFTLLDGADKTDGSAQADLSYTLDLINGVVKLRRKLNAMPRGVKVHLAEAHFARSHVNGSELLDRLDVDLEDVLVALGDSKEAISEFADDSDERGKADQARRNRLLKCVAEILSSGRIRMGKAGELAGRCLRAAGIKITDDPGELAKLIRGVEE
jgi:hypothetical protein